MSGRNAASADMKDGVRVRRAYFDCRFGQLHVRTAFSSSGGFDERTTLLCLHPHNATGRVFDGLLPELATDRSVYAPDMPGTGESDPCPQPGPGDYAAAMSDLMRTLHIRKIDVIAYGNAAAVAAELARIAPELVRKRLDLIAGELDPTTPPNIPALVRRIRESFDLKG